MKITAHRGYSGIYPENTMLAFRKAVEAGADEIELDVQLSKDGRVVVFHDETLDRLTNVRGNIRDYDFSELSKLNVSPGSDKSGFNPIPSLDEYFTWLKTTNIVTNIELKNSRFYYTGLEEKTIGLITQYGVIDQVYFSSFNHPSLIKCKKINPAIRCGVLTGTMIGNAGYYVKSSGLDFYHPEIKSLNDEICANCTDNGVEINVWTVDDMAGLVRSLNWNCRSVITNYPDVCKNYVRG